MSEKRYRVFVNSDDHHQLVDTINQKTIGDNKPLAFMLEEFADLLNQQADELREACAGAAAMREAVVTAAYSRSGDWYPKSQVEGISEVLEAVLKDNTTGAALLAELEQLQGYRAFVHSCIKSGEVCVYTFEEYLEKMKSE